jgi:hypothetical protein
MEVILPLFMFLVLLMIGVMVLTLSWNVSSGKKHQEHPINGTSFVPSHMFIAHDGCGGIALNEQALQICLLKNPAVTPHVLPVSCLIGSFLVKNGEIIGERLRTIPKGLIGFQQRERSRLEELIANRQVSSCHQHNQRIDLIVLIHDERDPLHGINFLDMETKEGGILFENSLATAAHWHKVLTDLIFQADRQAQFLPETDGQQGERLFTPAAEQLDVPVATEKKMIMPPQVFSLPEETIPAAKAD